MDLISKTLLAALVVALFSIKILYLRDSLNTERQQTEQLTQELARRNTILRHLQENAASHQQQLARLQTERQRLRTTLAEREALIETLHHDNALIQAWAATRLPDAIRRMLERPAQSGTRHPAPALPNRDAL